MRRAVLFAALAGLAGCKPVTEILLVVRSDVPDELKSVHVFVASSGTLPMGGTPYEALDVQDPGCQCLSDSGCPAVPFSLGMLPDNPDNLPDHPFELAVDGYARRGCSEDVFIEAKARVKFVHEKTLALYLDLLSACEGVICPPHFTCDPALRTCKDDTVPPDQLSPVDPGSFSIAELGPQPDFSTADFAGVDIAQPPDQSGLRDFTVLPDQAMPRDLAGVDLAGDMVSLPDLTPPPDLASVDQAISDMATPPKDMAMGDFAMSDMASAPPDMAMNDMAMSDLATGMKDMSVPPPDLSDLYMDDMSNQEGPMMDAGCFVAGTLVWTATGPLPIERIPEGAEVMAIDADHPICDQPAPPVRVSHFLVREVHDLVDVTIGGETIGATLDHPFFVVGRGFVPAGELRPGDIIERAGGGGSPVERIGFRYGLFTVYNLALDQLHGYFVGSGRWLVHNPQTC